MLGMQPGDRMVWFRALRSGYGYIRRIPVTVVKLGATRVQVEAPLKKGGTKRVWVKPENLFPAE
jgi:hypothetical protein